MKKERRKRRKEGKKERRKEGKKERRKEGKKERRKEGKKERRKEGKKERRKEGKKERRKEGKKERRKEGKKERRKEGNGEKAIVQECHLSNREGFGWLVGVFQKFTKEPYYLMGYVFFPLLFRSHIFTWFHYIRRLSPNSVVSC